TPSEKVFVARASIVTSYEKPDDLRGNYLDIYRA
ncbi:hypothetical protein EV688_11952, partial [Chromatocurvus halotolerans]